MNGLLFARGDFDAAFNMAFDEWMLSACVRTPLPLLRLYGWRFPAITFGRLQKPEDALLEASRAGGAAIGEMPEIARRPSGGGVVFHEGTATYALVLPSCSAAAQLPSLQLYRHLHELLMEHLGPLYPPLCLLEDCSARGGTSCFRNPSLSDLMLKNAEPNGPQKVAGAALRRTRSGILIQGSLRLIDPSLLNAVEAALAEALTRLAEVCRLIAVEADPVAQEGFARLKTRSQTPAFSPSEKTKPAVTRTAG